MTTAEYVAALALIKSLYNSADLSHDQANPIIAALEAAIKQRGDFATVRAALTLLLSECDPRRKEWYLMVSSEGMRLARQALDATLEE